MAKKILTILCLLGLSAIIFFAASSRKNRVEAPVEDEIRLIRLNDSITNAMSDIPELEGLDSRMEKYIKRWQMKGAE